jgi:type IV secretory pathway component VirB8
VRYFKAKRQAGSAEEARTYWIASIRYTYAAPSSDPSVRRWNPLGFKIVDFRPEPEVGGEAAAPSAAAPPASGRVASGGAL